MSGADVLGSAPARLLIVAVYFIAKCDPEVPPRVGVWLGYGSYPIGYGWGIDHTLWGMALPWPRKVQW